MRFPAYAGGSIVNLMSSIGDAFGARPCVYPVLRQLDRARLHAARNIVLLVIDGLGYQYLTEAGRGSQLHEHLQAPITSVFPPTTATAITTFLTGYAPQQHGFTGWFTYFRELAAILAVLPFTPRHGGPSLGKSGVTPAQLSGAGSFFDRIDAPSHVVVPTHIARSDFNRAFTARARIWPYQTLPRMFERIEHCLAEDRDTAYVYAYWPRLDSLAHAHGVGSREVRRHFTELDAAFARFAAAIAGSGTVLIVTADHGFIDTEPRRRVQLADHPGLADTLLLPLSGEGRLAYCYVDGDKRTEFEHYVRSELAHCTVLHRSEELVRDGWFGLGEAYPRLGERLGHYALAMRDNYTIKDWIMGEKPYRHIGVHGGGSAREMLVPLIVLGP